MTNKIYRKKRVGFLRSYAVIREVVAAMKGISKRDLDLILMLDDITHFTKAHFKEGVWWGGWDNDRMNRLQEKGMIIKFYKGLGRGDHSKYKLTLGARTMVTNIYKMCYNEKPIPESANKNPIMKRKTYSHNKLADYILNHNKQLQNERRKRFND